MAIKDSGSRRQFESGAVRDINENKGRCDLIPIDILSDVLQASRYDTNVLYKLGMYQQTKDINCVTYAIDEFIRSCGWDIPTAMLELSIHYAEGAQKYDEWNWAKGIPSHCYLDSAIRHFLKWERCDDDEMHNRAFIWNCFGLLWNHKHRPDLEDIECGLEW